MACGCGGARNANQTYVYTNPSGVQQSYKTEIEAKAAQIRAGGGGSIRSVIKG